MATFGYARLLRSKRLLVSAWKSYDRFKNQHFERTRLRKAELLWISIAVVSINIAFGYGLLWIAFCHETMARLLMQTN